MGAEDGDCLVVGRIWWDELYAAGGGDQVYGVLRHG